MYAVLKTDNTIGAFETRNIPLDEFVHEGIRHLYVEIDNSSDLKIGDIWCPEENAWQRVELLEEPSTTLYEPPRKVGVIDVAQMISDLQADLLIAGVI